MAILSIHRLKFVFTWKVKQKLLGLLVISSLVLPFSLSAITDSTLSSDRAVFRLSGLVFFTSDIRKNIKALKIFKCLGEKASQRSFVEIFSSGNFRSLLSNQISLTDDNLLSLIKIEKLKLAALGRSRTNLTVKDLRKISTKCGKVNWSKLADSEKSLLIAEVFLRDRFSHEKDVFNRLVEYSRSLSIQESHEVYAKKMSKNLQGELNKVKVNIKDNIDAQIESTPVKKSNIVK